MTNEEFKKNNDILLENVVSAEKQVLDSINGLSGVNLTPVAPTVAGKIKTLVDLVENDKKPIDQHMLVIAVPQYLINTFSEYMHSIQIYFDALTLSVLNQDKDKWKELVNQQGAFLEMWNGMREYLEQFDFRANMEDIIRSDNPIPIVKKFGDVVFGECISELDDIEGINQEIADFTSGPDDKGPHKP